MNGFYNLKSNIHLLRSNGVARLRSAEYLIGRAGVCVCICVCPHRITKLIIIVVGVSSDSGCKCKSVVYLLLLIEKALKQFGARYHNRGAGDDVDSDDDVVNWNNLSEAPAADHRLDIESCAEGVRCCETGGKNNNNKEKKISHS